MGGEYSLDPSALADGNRLPSPELWVEYEHAGVALELVLHYEYRRNNELRRDMLSSH